MCSCDEPLRRLVEEAEAQIQNHSQKPISAEHGLWLITNRAVEPDRPYVQQLIQFKIFILTSIGNSLAHGEHLSYPQFPGQSSSSPFDRFFGRFLKASMPYEPFLYPPFMLKQLHAFISVSEREPIGDGLANTDPLWEHGRIKQWIIPHGETPFTYLQVPPGDAFRLRKFVTGIIRLLQKSYTVLHMLCGLPPPFAEFAARQGSPTFILKQLLYQAMFHLRRNIDMSTLSSILKSLKTIKSEDDVFILLELVCSNTDSGFISVVIEITDQVWMGANEINQWPLKFSELSGALRDHGVTFQALVLCPGFILDGFNPRPGVDFVIKPEHITTTDHVLSRRMPRRHLEPLPFVTCKPPTKAEIITLSDDSSVEDADVATSSVEQTRISHATNSSVQCSASGIGESTNLEFDNSVVDLSKPDAQPLSTTAAGELPRKPPKPVTSTEEPTGSTELIKTRQDIKLAIVCALTLEADAVHALFEEYWEDLDRSEMRSPGDTNAYSFGVFGNFATVLVHMPGMGKTSASIVATNCRSSFPNLKLALVVGICGGVPFCNKGKTEVVLGDVIVSEGLVPYDYGRRYPDRFMRRDSASDAFGKPPTELRGLLNKLKGRFGRRKLQERMAAYLQTLRRELGDEVEYLGAGEDLLFEGAYTHRHRSRDICGICSDSAICNGARSATCDELACDKANLVPRKRLEAILRDETAFEPAVHFGYVACGDQVMKSGNHRDTIAQEEGIIAFEMEGAGVWDIFPCLVIKSVCDYADSHKHKKWQNYAAGTAAACSKALIQEWYM